jgi:hypothetical protein
MRCSLYFWPLVDEFLAEVMVHDVLRITKGLPLRSQPPATDVHAASMPQLVSFIAEGADDVTHGTR